MTSRNRNTRCTQSWPKIASRAAITAVAAATQPDDQPKAPLRPLDIRIWSATLNAM